MNRLSAWSLSLGVSSIFASLILATDFDFKSQIVTTSNSPLTILVPDQTYLRIHTFTQNGGTQRGSVTSVAGTPTPTPTTTVTPTPALSTNAGPGVALSTGDNLTDTATLSGDNNPTGTITFTLESPNSMLVYTDIVTVTGNGTYTTAVGNNPGGFSPAATGTGTYMWSASYSGDPSGNAAATDDGQNETETVTATPTPTPTVTPVPIPGVVLTAAIVSSSAAPGPIKGATIEGPATVTVTRGNMDCFITYNKRAQPTPTPAE